MNAVTDSVLSATAVELTIPADARYLAAVRMVSAAVAAEMGFSVDDIDELRIAVNEMVTLYLEAMADGGRMRLCFEPDHAGTGSLRVTGGPVDPDHGPGNIDVDDLARRILSALTESFTIDAPGFELRKSAS